MNSEQFQRAADIFLQARSLAGDVRETLLKQACGNDAALRAEVDRLLSAGDLETPFPTLSKDLEALREHLRVEPTEPGERIGRYKIIEKLGEGGFGSVYVAEQEQPVRRRVALKVIKLGMDTKQFVARFEAERQALAMMDHAHIAKVFDAGASETGRPYFVMELVSGVPITTYCDQNRLTARQRLELFIPICQAVQHAHQKGIIHRDLKPSNVLVTLQDGKPVPKVIDFGIAKATRARLTEKTVFTESNQLIGTPEYMSPEQAELNVQDVDTRSDIYSLGVLLYELLAGTTPFDPRELRSKAFAEMQRVIREVDPPKPSTRLSNLQTLPSVAALRGTEPAKLSALIRGELDWIVMKCLEKDRTRRYEAASGLAKDLEHYLADEPVSAAAPSRAYRVRKFVRRNRGPVVASAIMLMLLVAGVLGTTIGLVGQMRARRYAQQQAAVAQAVSQFQREMLASADPERLLGENVTVLKAVSAAARELDSGKLKDQPMVEAGVRETIGSTLRMLGRYDDAEPHLRKALDLRRSELPADHLDIARSQDELATLLEDRGKLNEAEPLFRESLELIRSGRPAVHKDVADAATNLGHLLQLQGKLDAAEPLFVEALDIHRQVRPLDEARLANGLNNLAGVRNSQRKYAEAEPLFVEVLAIRRRLLPAGHPAIATSLSNVAFVLRMRGKLADAETLFREALQINRDAFPAGHPTVARSVSMLAVVLEKQGKFSEADSLHRESIDLMRKVHPDGHPDLGRTIFMRAKMLGTQQRFADAEPLFREALSMFRKFLPAGHRDILGCLNEYAVMVQKQERFAEAEALFRESRDLARKSLAAGALEVTTSSVNLAGALRRQRKFAEAEKELIDTERVLATESPVPRDRYRDCVNGLVALYVDWEKAEPNKGHSASAAEWQAKLPTTGPATTR